MSDALIDRLYWIASEPGLSKASADDIRRAAIALARNSGAITRNPLAPTRPEGAGLKPLPRPAPVNNDAEADGA